MVYCFTYYKSHKYLRRLNQYSYTEREFKNSWVTFAAHHDCQLLIIMPVLLSLVKAKQTIIWGLLNHPVSHHSSNYYANYNCYNQLFAVGRKHVLCTLSSAFCNLSHLPRTEYPSCLMELPNAPENSIISFEKLSTTPPYLLQPICIRHHTSVLFCIYLCKSQYTVYRSLIFRGL